MSMRGKSIFVTGGTGFFGIWILESFLWANEQLGLNAKVTVLSRSPRHVYEKMPHLLTHSNLSFIPGDIRDFLFPPGIFDCVIHAAGTPDSSHIFEALAEGTKRVIAFATYAKVSRFLFVSSGAVYDACRFNGPIAESDFKLNASKNELSDYARGKIEAERLCDEWALGSEVSCSIARCFSFIGPYFPLEANYAASSFLKCALKGERLRLTGDPTIRRSFLYAADLAVWLWTILVNGKTNRAYNVGSPDDLSLLDFAKKIAKQAGVNDAVDVPENPVQSSQRRIYVPSLSRANEELNLMRHISLDDAIRRTLAFYQ